MSRSRGDDEPRAGGDSGLDIQRQAVRGFAVGGLLAAAVFVRYALLPGTTWPLALYVGLAVVLGVSAGLLVTVALVGWQAHRLGREG